MGPGPPPSSGIASWIVVAGKRKPLREGENTIRRDPLCSVWIDVASVSRHHARIVCSGVRAVLEDIGSMNGTTVGGERLPEPRELRDGDRISFGSVGAIYCASEAGIPTVAEGERSG